MDLISAAEILAFSSPMLDALLAGSMDKLKEVGKGLTAKTLDTVQEFWKRLTQTRPEAEALARRSAAEPDATEALKRLIAEAVDTDPTLKRLAEELRPVTQVGYQSGGTTQITGDGGVNVAGDVHGGITLTNRRG